MFLRVRCIKLPSRWPKWQENPILAGFHRTHAPCRGLPVQRTIAIVPPLWSQCHWFPDLLGQGSREAIRYLKNCWRRIHCSFVRTRRNDVLSYVQVFACSDDGGLDWIFAHTCSIRDKVLTWSPKQKRIKKNLKQRQKKGGNCLQLGHNKRWCVEQPAWNAQAERHAIGYIARLKTAVRTAVRIAVTIAWSRTVRFKCGHHQPCNCVSRE